MDLFGFGQFSGVELPAEAKGVIPTSKWKRINYGENWATGDTYNAVIGQGYVLVTPLQMLNAYNAVINGGTLYRPQIVDKILGGEGEVLQDIQPEVIRQLPVSPENILLVQTGLRRTVVSGTLSGDIGILGEADIPIVDVPDVNVAGKTGTAEYCDAIAWDKGLCIPGQWPQHAWTMMFAPYEKPEVSVIVFVYNGGEGSKTAAPIASAILRAYFMLKAADAGAPPSAAPNP
jgi:penicillin-binding protein 2